MKNFRETLDSCGLVDLDYKGAAYTWSGQRAGGQTIWCRLDRFCASPAWIARFNEYIVLHRAVAFSDHHALMLKLEPDRQN